MDTISRFAATLGVVLAATALASPYLIAIAGYAHGF